MKTNLKSKVIILITNSSAIYYQKEKVTKISYSKLNIYHFYACIVYFTSNFKGKES